MKQDLVLVPMKIEVVASRQERERRERAQAHQVIAQDSMLDWRSYERRTIPNRWRVR